MRSAKWAIVGGAAFIIYHYIMIVQGNSLTIGSAAKATLQRWRVPLGFVTAVLFVIFSRPSWMTLTVGVPLALCGAAIS